ncbi:MAG TPA: VIT1/CCC1 transporter family protein [Solirubrobacteraceae bacterium]|nr:VIT1/CCC1 transporter family protein [Solirubrobacteraceae bacterium]
MSQDVAERLVEAWTDEVQATVVYGLIANRESDPQRAAVLRRLAEIEISHRSRLEARMRELGIEIPDERSVGISTWRRLQARFAPVERLIARQEAMEQAIAAEIDERPTGDADTDRLLEEIRDEETQHTVALAHLRAGTLPSDAKRPSDEGPQVRLTRILGRERWHRGNDSWISGVIYGANDGLAAVFGLVAGFSGATGGSHLVLTAGLFGAIGSALSMATGAYLAERSVAEVAAANLARERDEVLSHPEEEKEELSLFYQLKGLTVAEADMVVERIAEDPEQLFRAIAIEEFGSADAERGDAVQAALAGGISTALGAMVPVIPFFFLTGTAGVVVAAAVSLVAHFAVGAAKSLFTLRTAWSAGIEMTIAGAIVGGATYLLGLGIGT